jgi:hypothetical protein
LLFLRPELGLFSVAAKRFRRVTEETDMAAKSKTQNPKATARHRESARLAPSPSPEANRLTRLDLLVEKLAQPDGASLAELTAATGWQVHSVRGALAGSLKKKGHVILSEKTGDVRRYRIEAAR